MHGECEVQDQCRIKDEIGFACCSPEVEDIQQSGSSLPMGGIGGSCNNPE